MWLELDYDSALAEAVFKFSDDISLEVSTRLRQIVLAADPVAILSPSTLSCAWVSALAVVPALDGLRQTYALELRATTAAQARLAHFRDQRRALDAARKRRPIEITEDEVTRRLEANGFTKRTLTTEQMRDVIRLVSLPNGANFSVPGAGKTTVAMAVHTISCNPGDHMLVVAPKNAFSAWSEVIVDCFADDAPNDGRVDFQRLDGDTINLEASLHSGRRRFIISYDKLIRERPVLLRHLSTTPTHVVLDESHRMKAGEASQRGAVLLSLAALPVRRDILSGTPAPNSVRDLQSQFDFLWPGSDLGRRAAQAARPRDVVANFYVRTTKGEMGLPPPTRRFERIEMAPSQLILYANLRSEAMRQLMNIGRAELDLNRARKSVMRLLQVSTNPVLAMRSMFEGDPGEEPTTPAEHLVRGVLDEGDSPKILRAVEMARENAAQGRKTVIWTIFRDTINRLELLLQDLNATSIHGGVPSGDVNSLETREGRIAYFHGPDCAALVANPSACSEGISLHRVCHDAVYLDRSYNAAHYLQSIDRIHRLGLAPDTTTTINILNSVTPQGLASIDHAVSRRLRTKVREMNAILEDDDLQRIALDEEESDRPVDVDIALDDLVELFEQLQRSHAPEPEEEDV